MRTHRHTSQTHIHIHICMYERAFISLSQCSACLYVCKVNVVHTHILILTHTFIQSKLLFIFFFAVPMVFLLALPPPTLLLLLLRCRSGPLLFLLLLLLLRCCCAAVITLSFFFLFFLLLISFSHKQNQNGMRKVALLFVFVCISMRACKYTCSISICVPQLLCMRLSVSVCLCKVIYVICRLRLHKFR